MKWTCVAPRLASYIDLDHVNDLIEKVACWHYQSSIMNLTPVRKKIFMCEKDFWLHAFIALRSWDSLRVYLLRGHCLVSIFESFLYIYLFYFIWFSFCFLIIFLAERSLRQCRSSASWVGNNFYTSSVWRFILRSEKINLNTNSFQRISLHEMIMNVSTRRVRSDEQGIDVVRLMCGSKHVLTKISSLSPNLLCWRDRLGSVGPYSKVSALPN